MNADRFMKVNAEAAEAASSALARLMGRPIAVKMKRTELLSGPGGPSLQLGEERTAGVAFDISGGAHGEALLGFPLDATRMLLDPLVGKFLGGEDDSDAMDRSALKEIGNVICGSYLAVLSNDLRAKIVPGVPRLELGSFGEMCDRTLARLPGGVRETLLIEVEIELPGRIMLGRLLLFLETERLLQVGRPGPEMKEELNSVFMRESRELLKSLREGLAAAPAPASRPALAELFLKAHMLKGDVTFAGLREMEMLVGPLAEHFKSAQERGGIGRAETELLLETVEACEQLLEGRKAPGSRDLMERLNRAAALLGEGDRPRSALTVLLIEDSDFQTRIIEKELAHSRRTSFSVEKASRLEDGLKRAVQAGIDAVLLDLILPDSQGVETFVRLSAQAPELPVVILTTSDDDELAFEALRRGAQDYLVKSSVDSALLSRVIRYAVERKRIEAALRSARSELEVRVRERTAELTRSNEALKLANAELMMFASSASHELLEPLRKIVNFGDLLKERAGSTLDPEALDHLRKMQEGALRLGELIRSLRGLTRVTMAAAPLEAVDLNAVVGEVLADLAPLLSEIGGRVEAGVLPTIRGDAVQLEQLFRNLIGNAVKYRTPGRPLVVEIAARSPKPGVIELSVSDNAIGFEQKYAEQIFKPFQRLHGLREYEGIGMGLAICARIIWRHGGVISARSEPGKGSVFLMTLTALEAQK